MSRRLPKTPKIKRRGAKQDPEKKIVVVCEGRNTEPQYIKDFARDKKHPLVDCKTIDGVGVPKTIVDRAIHEKEKLSRIARRSGNSFDKKYEVWCVSDRDEHHGMAQEMQRARDNGLLYALSNPCVELWGYLHYFQNDAPIHRHDMQRMLTGVMPGYDHAHGAIFDYESMKESYNDALSRAKELIRRREEEGGPCSNPSTNIYELMESIGKAKEDNK